MLANYNSSLNGSNMQKAYTHKNSTEQDLTKEEYKTSHLLSVSYNITALDRLDINLTIRVGVI